MSFPLKHLERHYSGPRSTAFWDRIAALPEVDKNYLYERGVALQALEERVLKALFSAEDAAANQRKTAAAVTTPPVLHRSLAKRVAKR